MQAWMRAVRLEKASAIRFQVGGAVEYRAHGRWRKLPEARIPKRRDLETCLTEIFGRSAAEVVPLRASTEAWTYSFDRQPIGVQYIHHDVHPCASVRWHNENDIQLADWGLPSHLTEKWCRQSGLNLVYGPRLSGRSAFLARLATKLAEHQGVQYFSDFNELRLPFALSAIELLALQTPPHLGALVFVDSADPAILNRAMDLAFSGATVFASVTGVSLPTTLVGLQQQSGKGALFWPLLAERLVSCAGLRLLPGVEDCVHPALELLLDTSDAQEMIREGSVFGLVEIMSRGGDKTPMRTLNQALLQLLLKRKIELRVGFDESPRPQELDELLQRIGV